MSLIELKGVYKTYEDEAATAVLHGVDLKIERGEFVSIMGPSGSGKSTLMNIVGLLDKPTTGSYLFSDKDTSNLNEGELAKLRRKTIGFVFQNFNLLPRLSVSANVALPMIYARVPKKQRKSRTAAILREVNLSKRSNFRPTQLSGGEKQRVAIARALANKPKVILADEPTGNLDTKTGAAIMNILKRLNKTGDTVIVVTHDREVAAHTDRIIEIRDGKVRK